MSKRSLVRVGVAVLSLAVIMPSMAPAQAANDIKIGVITSTSGPLGSYGLAYNDGLAWGLNYYTGGKMSINGAKLVVTSKDDGADPASATASFKDMVGNGTKIIVGTASSGVALTLAPLLRRTRFCTYLVQLRTMQLHRLPISMYSVQETHLLRI